MAYDAMPGIAAHLQAALEELDSVDRAYVAAGESGFDIRIITAKDGRLEDLTIDGIGEGKAEVTGGDGDFQQLDYLIV